MNWKKKSINMSKNTEIVQFKKPYQSTIEFEKFLKNNNFFNRNNKSILDLGCGIGSNINYFSKKYPNINFTGWDYAKSQIKKANKFNNYKNNKFYVKNILKINKNKNRYDALFSTHTFCVFKKIEPVVKSIKNLKAKWIAINSLFYEGYLDVLIHIRDLNNKIINDNNPDADFNIHSLPNTIKIFEKYGYKLITKKNFFPKQKIKKKKKTRGSYTIKTEFNKNTLFSGPVHLPWYFILFKKND